MATGMVVRVRIAAAIQINQSYSTGGANVDPSSSASEVTTLWHYTNTVSYTHLTLPTTPYV